MAKRPVKKKRQPDYQQEAHKVLDAVAPDAEPKVIKPASGTSASKSSKVHFTYHFVRVHQTLKTTPAVMAGIVARPWTISDLVELADVPQFAGK